MMYFEDFEVGRSYEAGPVEIDRDEISAFAARYDPLPLHLDEDYARQARFKGLICSGMMSFLLTWSDFAKKNIWGDSLLAGMAVSISWLAPVYPGDRLTGLATIIGKTPRNKYNGLVRWSFDVFNQDQVKVITDVSEILFKRRPAQEN